VLIGLGRDFGHADVVRIPAVLFHGSTFRTWIDGVG
jgi:hypothetical protein